MGGLRANVLALIFLLAVDGSAHGGTAKVEVDGPRPHPSILIVGDAGFRDLLSGVRGGAGTEVDPYIISGWALTHHRAAALRLVDTRAHVIVEDIYIGGVESGPGTGVDCSLDARTCGGPQGIDLFNARNVTVRNVRVLAGAVGIEVRASADVRIEDVALGTGDSPFAGVETGLVVLGSERVRAVNVSVDAFAAPFRIVASRDVVVTDATFVGRGDPAPIAGVVDVTLARVEVVSTPLLLSSSITRLALVDNTFRDGTDGVVSFGGGPADGLLVCGNRFERLRGGLGALFVERFRDVRIAGNAFVDGTAAIDMIHMDDVLVERNVFAGQSLYHLNLVASRGTVVGNSFAADAPGGVRLDGAAIDARGNWWGHPSGPSGAGVGSGAYLEVVHPATAFSPWLAEPPSAHAICPLVDVGSPGAHAPYAVEARARAGAVDVAGHPVALP